MPVGARLGGHIVQGHVDGVGEVLEVRPGAQWSVLRISLPADLAPLVVDKGSISVDGTSLTVSAVSEPAAPSTGSGTGHWFEVSLIPETLAATTLGSRAVGEQECLPVCETLPLHFVENELRRRKVEHRHPFGCVDGNPDDISSRHESIVIRDLCQWRMDVRSANLNIPQPVAATT